MPTKPASPHHVLESIAITGGYLDGLSIDLADGLNCVIGGRGSGKTTLLQLAGFALGVAPRSAPASDAFVRDILGGGRVTVRVRTEHGMRYEASRSAGEPARAATPDGELADVSLDGELFQIELYAPHQIESIAIDASAQLALLDRFADAELKRLEEGIVDATRKLDEEGARLAALRRDLDADEERTRELPSIEEALRGLHATSGASAEAGRALEAKVQRGRERAAIARVNEAVAKLRAEVVALSDDARRRLTLDVGDNDTGPNRDAMAALTKDLGAASAQVDAAFRAVLDRLTGAGSAIAKASHTVNALHAKQEEALAAILAKDSEDKHRAAERARLEARHAELTAASARLAELRRERDARRDARAALIGRLHALRHERFVARERACREISTALDGDVRVSIEENGDRSAYEALLQDILRGSNIRPTSYFKRVSRRIAPESLAALVETNDAAPLIEVDDSKTGKPERAQRLLDGLRTSGRVHELETVAHADVPLIELRAGLVYKPSAEVSTGQRCTCILPILLLRGKRPLLIDQPEDNLDNAFVYDVLVKTVARAKRSRQLVFVTHNPNIPVLGDADRVVVLESDGVHGKATHAGSVDELRAPIERILEGGREAFLERGRRYGHGAAR